MIRRSIIRNRIKCVHCNDIIESFYTHDFKFCKCGKVAVDGGHEYLKRSFTTSPNDFIDMSETVARDVEVARCKEDTDGTEDQC